MFQTIFNIYNLTLLLTYALVRLQAESKYYYIILPFRKKVPLLLKINNSLDIQSILMK
jgi:hypothetical protein